MMIVTKESWSYQMDPDQEEHLMRNKSSKLLHFSLLLSILMVSSSSITPSQCKILLSPFSKADDNDSNSFFFVTLCHMQWSTLLS